MIPLDDLIRATQADVLVAGARPTLDGFAQDSRLVSPGDCFVAVRGVHGDGADYAMDALERGAGALLLERSRIGQGESQAMGLLEHARRSGAAVLAVNETRLALRHYGAHILARWQPRVIAVAGATGKTTTKEAIADVLATAAPTFRSWRNYNDLLGVPLSLGRLEPTHRYAVIELGADHPGEIAELCRLLRPHVGVVTNVSATHLLYFADVATFAEELANLPRALPVDGVALLNGGDPAVRAMRRQTSARVLELAAGAGEALHAGAGERAATYDVLPLGEEGRIALTLRPRRLDDPDAAPITFPHLHGEHWDTAVLAALAVGEALGVPAAQALEVLRELRPLPGRMRWLAGAGGLTLLDDSHNATPASAAAGLHALDGIARARGRARIAVLGDMLRLGAAESDAHRTLGTLAARGSDYLVTRGLLGEIAAEAARREGMGQERIAVTHTAEDAARAVRAFAAQITTSGSAPTAAAPVVYIKGSEEQRMEQVTALLLEHPEQAEELLDRQTQAWRRFVVMQPDRPTWLEVDLGAIGNNTRLVKELVGPDMRVLVSLKADAYGHGALRVARTVLRNGGEWLGVATVSEAAPLREAGVDAPILVFGYIAPWQAREVARLDLRATVYSLDTAQALSRAACDLGREVRVHVKLDTGMARLGLRAEDVAGVVAFCETLAALPGLRVEGVFTHFATADSADQSYARRQLERFNAVLRALQAHGLRPPLVHAANSAAMLALPEARFDLVRPGVAIYGLHPSDEVRLPPAFRPALAFKTQVAQVKDIPPGEGISYGATYVTTTTTRIAVLPVGYADGFRRAPTNWGEVLVRGRRAPLLGRVCMDQCMVDVTHISGVRTGDEVVLIGRQGDDEITAEAVARRLGTIAYEVVAELLARVPRVS
jgi:Alr-MurF fusion protein